MRSITEQRMKHSYFLAERDKSLSPRSISRFVQSFIVSKIEKRIIRENIYTKLYIIGKIFQFVKN